MLCRCQEDRDRMLEAGSSPGPRFSLTVTSWLRQSHASMVSLLYVVPLSLRGVPTDASPLATATKVIPRQRQEFFLLLLLLASVF